MKKFNALDVDKKSHAYQKIKKIADYNRQWFFSKEFDKLVHRELVTNIQSAVKKITQGSI